MSVLDERDARLAKLTQGIDCEALPMLRKIPTQDELWFNLYESINTYLNRCLTITGKSSYIDLPNITPNGIVVPKYEIMEQYYGIHQRVVAIIANLNGFVDNIDKVHNVVTLRLSRGFPSPQLDSRPRASTKIHSDVWSGEFTNTVMAFIPIYGDFINNGIAFYDTPDRIYPDYIKTLDNYDEASELVDGLSPYDVCLETGSLYLTDPFLLHKTVKNMLNPESYRLSIDFRFTSKFSCSTDIKTDTQREDDYISYQDWSNIGKSLFLRPHSSIFDSIKDVTKNAYAANFDLLSKKD